MDVTIKLFDNNEIKDSFENYSVQALADMLNDQKKVVVVIGSSVVQRQQVARVVPEREAPGNVEVRLTDGTTITAQVDNYIPQEIADLLNDNSKSMSALGDIVLQRYSVMRITPKSEPVE
ncbi:hypothetical protein ACFFJQ_06980 [Bacillus capparidis]|uniref:Replication terminator protein n=1 Tax=Bacillus capparidis TaxID=1840411 RepID=A0ABS4D1K7_9BACI|nr:hypothetical protein [Bacillus capparidis]MBP1083511.1 hypothetical protein [Bacillus capparidis]MED1094710.1 hypothetical protein [Bacillus capparidis]